MAFERVQTAGCPGWTGSERINGDRINGLFHLQMTIVLIGQGLVLGG